jgi:hypothetical protein
VCGDDGQGELLHKGGDLSDVREGGHIGVADSFGTESICLLIDCSKAVILVV